MITLTPSRWSAISSCLLTTNYKFPPALKRSMMPIVVQDWFLVYFCGWTWRRREEWFEKHVSQMRSSFSFRDVIDHVLCSPSICGLFFNLPIILLLVEPAARLTLKLEVRVGLPYPKIYWKREVAWETTNCLSLFINIYIYCTCWRYLNWCQKQNKLWFMIFLLSTHRRNFLGFSRIRSRAVTDIMTWSVHVAP